MVNGKREVMKSNTKQITFSNNAMPNITKWTSKLKSDLIKAIYETQVISATHAQLAYNITDEELDTWKNKYYMYGKRGLRVTHLKRYRK